jgi:hypothetical protein
MALQSLIDRPKELLELINDCLKEPKKGSQNETKFRLKPNKKETQLYGEVFTHMNIIYEMLDNLDKYYIKTYNKSIFTIKDFKWFDPAVGMGNFIVAVYLRLYQGLKEQIPNDRKRKQHIIENMLYMSELNKKNVFICQQIFDINDEYKLNLYQGDTLFFNPKDTFKVDKFDVILGNPPYNKGGIKSHTGKQLGEKNETIWTKFIEKSFQWLKNDGFLLFINPLSWLKKSHSLHNILLEKHIIWMKLWDNSQSKLMINADIPISLYILNNKIIKNENNTEIISIMKRRNLTTISNVYLNKEYSIPLAYHSIFNKLLNFIEKNNCKLEYNTKTIKSTGIRTKLPSNYRIEDMWAVDTYIIKGGIMVKKVNEKHIDMDKRKLIIANKASFNGAFIDDGKLSLTGSDKFYIMGDNLEVILKLLSYKLCDIISHFTKYRQDFLEREVFRYIPDIRKLGFLDIIDIKDFYNLIGLTNEEIIQINNHKTNENVELLTQSQPIPQQLSTQQLPIPQPIPQPIQQQLPYDFNKMTIPQLKEECKKKNIKHPSKINKQPLLELLLKNLRLTS